MRLRLVLPAAAVLTAAVLIIVQARQDGAPAAAPPAGRSPSRPALPPPPTPAGPVRNIFIYALPPERLERHEPPPSFVTVEPPEPEPFELPGEEPIRLVGLVRKGGGLKAALAIAGQVVVLGPGESAEGYTVLRVDEDTGAVLRTPEGTELALSLPAS